MAVRKATISVKKRWKAMVDEAKGPKIVSTFEDPVGRRYSFLYTKGEISLYPDGGEEFYSMDLDQVGRGPGMGGFDLIRQMVGLSHESMAFRWLEGCLEGARGFGK